MPTKKMVPKHIDNRGSDILGPLWSQRLRTIVSKPNLFFSKLCDAIKPASCSRVTNTFNDYYKYYLKLLLNVDGSRSVMRPYNKLYIELSAFVLVSQWSK